MCNGLVLEVLSALSVIWAEPDLAAHRMQGWGVPCIRWGVRYPLWQMMDRAGRTVAPVRSLPGFGAASARPPEGPRRAPEGPRRAPGGPRRDSAEGGTKSEDQRQTLAAGQAPDRRTNPAE